MPLAAHAAWRGDTLVLDAAVGHPSERAAPLLRVQTSGRAADGRAAESLGGAAARALLAAGAAPYLAAAERLAATPDAP
jgi:hypothetical protein